MEEDCSGIFFKKEGKEALTRSPLAQGRGVPTGGCRAAGTFAPGAESARPDLCVAVDHRPRGHDPLGMSLSQEPGSRPAGAN